MRIRNLVIVAFVVLVVVVLVGLVWWYQRGDAPESASMESAVARVESRSTGGLSTATTSVLVTHGTQVAEPPRTQDGPLEPSVTVEDNQVPLLGVESETTTSAGIDGSGGTVIADSAPEGTQAPALDGGQVDDSTLSGLVDDDPAVEEHLPSGPAEAAAGVWAVETATGEVDLLSEPAVSFVGFRADEVLAGGIGKNTAVGRTPDVAGSIEVTDTALVAAEVVVDFRTLRTDDSHRDSHVQEELRTDEFPYATFSLVDAVDLSDATGFSGSATGDLTIAGVTNRVTFELEARLVDETLVVVGSAPVVFADYGLRVPPSRVVVSAEDHGVMEFQLFFARQPDSPPSESDSE